LDFPLEENFFPSNFEKILWSNKFLKGPNFIKKSR
jgi:hypothetical protein